MWGAGSGPDIGGAIMTLLAAVTVLAVALVGVTVAWVTGWKPTPMQAWCGAVGVISFVGGVVFGARWREGI